MILFLLLQIINLVSTFFPVVYFPHFAIECFPSYILKRKHFSIAIR